MNTTTTTRVKEDVDEYEREKRDTEDNHATLSDDL